MILYFGMQLGRLARSHHPAAGRLYRLQDHFPVWGARCVARYECGDLIAGYTAPDKATAWRAFWEGLPAVCAAGRCRFSHQPSNF